jgi:non-specific serine/threonine protein kinase
MDTQEALRCALASGDDAGEAEPRRPVALGKRSATLSQREWEIATLLAEGLRNDQIAARLVVSKRTVENHVSHILAKLGMASRSQVVAWVLAQGLPSPEAQARNSGLPRVLPLRALRPS